MTACRLDSAVVACALIGLLLLLIGNAVIIGAESITQPTRTTLARVGTLFAITGVAGTLASAILHLVADALSARAETDAARNAAPTGETDDRDAVTTALDAPAAHLGALANALIFAALGCATSDVFGNGGDAASRILLTAGASLSLAATLLLLLSEYHRAWDVAEVVRFSLTRAAGGAPPTPRSLRAAIGVLEARHARRVTCRRSAAAARRACGGAGDPAAPTLGDFARALSRFVMLAEAANAVGAALLLAGAIVLLMSAPRLAGVVLLEVAFAFLFAGVALIVCVGTRKVAGHRRGGRAHMEYDVRRALERSR